MKKPNRLTKGATIAIISPSWGGSSVFQHVYEKGIERLKKFGFKIKEYPSVKIDEEILYKNPQIRAKDVNDAFADKEVEGIICTIGGEDSIRVLPFLDADLIKNNPKFFMGYSDITTFNTYFNQLGIVTFNGPAVMAGFADPVELQKEFINFVNLFLFDCWNEFKYEPYSKYTEVRYNWNDPNCLNIKNTNYHITDGWNFIQGDKIVEGELFGGCIEVFEFMKGTKFWPNENFWKNKILFFETSEDKPTPYQVSCFLRNYGSQGILDKINGILFGRAKNYSDEEKKKLDELIIKILKEFNIEDLVVVTNLDFGHTDPQLIIPLGIKAQINPRDKSFKLIENIWNK